MRETNTEVLIVGAGPIGLWMALLLAERGIEVILIDRETRTTARSYACALHPATLELLDKYGLAESVIERGRRVETVAFYDGNTRQGEISFSKLGRAFPFLLVLPQNALEGLLEQRLRAAGVNVRWDHQFAELAQEEDRVASVIEELEGTSTGYIVPHWETVVKHRATLHSEFLVGADGHHSMVRAQAGLEYQRLGDAESFAAIEFDSEAAAPKELRVVLDQKTTNVLWPLGENRFRWTFQRVHAEAQSEFPEKERRGVRLDQPIIDEQVRQYVQKIAHQRAPWFEASIKKVHWCSEVSFERGLVARFGRKRCWLAGDAAHQTGPVGIQSMNMGFAEAASVASTLHKVLREGSALSEFGKYEQQQQTEWRRLLGQAGHLKPLSGATAWAAQCGDRLLSCLPAYGSDLEKLAHQLQLAAS
jgi:2-polyprenyl-6-methoxyphenol hydroxylase-like FAD-dependent oxidoreductase